jgi:hypothetical protein
LCFANAVDLYLARKRASLKPSSFTDTERYLRNHSAPLHRLKLGEIDRRKDVLRPPPSYLLKDFDVTPVTPVTSEGKVPKMGGKWVRHGV